MKYNWIIGIDPIKKRIVVKLNDPRNPNQANGLLSVRLIRATKISKQVYRDYQFAVESLFP